MRPSGSCDIHPSVSVETLNLRVAQWQLQSDFCLHPKVQQDITQICALPAWQVLLHNKSFVWRCKCVRSSRQRALQLLSRNRICFPENSLTFVLMKVRKFSQRLHLQKIIQDLPKTWEDKIKLYQIKAWNLIDLKGLKLLYWILSSVDVPDPLSAVGCIYLFSRKLTEFQYLQIQLRKENISSRFPCAKYAISR